MAELLCVLRKYSLPLFINARMHDERLTHMIHPTPPNMEAIRQFALDNRDIKIVLCHFKASELEAIRKELLSLENLYAEMSALRGNLLDDEPKDLFKKILYGSAFPLYPVTASATLIKTELIDEQVRRVFFEREDVLS